MNRKLYFFVPFVAGILAGAIFSSMKGSDFFASDEATRYVELVGRWIPMVAGLKGANNYTPVVGFAFAAFWPCMPLMVWCGWRLIEHAPEQAIDVFFKNSRLMRGCIYSFMALISISAYAIPFPAIHNGGAVTYISSGFFGMSFNLVMQALIYVFLGICGRYAVVEYRALRDAS